MHMTEQDTQNTTHVIWTLINLFANRLCAFSAFRTLGAHFYFHRLAWSSGGIINIPARSEQPDSELIHSP